VTHARLHQMYSWRELFSIIDRKNFRVRLRCQAAHPRRDQDGVDQSKNILRSPVTKSRAMFSIEPFGFASGERFGPGCPRNAKSLVHCVQLTQRLRVSKKTAFTVRHRQAQKCSFRTAVVNGELSTSTRVVTISQTNRSERFRTSAPGNRPPRTRLESRCRCRARACRRERR
jgi:hypothetical protein